MPSQASSALPRYDTTTFSDAAYRLRDLVSGNNYINGVNEVENANSTLVTVRQTLDQLRKWHYWEVRRQQSLKSYLISKIHPRPHCPSPSDLKDLALFFFPSRANGVTVDICDYGDGRFERCNTTVNNLESCQSRSTFGLALPTNSHQILEASLIGSRFDGC